MRALLLALALLVPAVALGQCAGQPELVVAPRDGFRVTQRVVFVIDVSGSMDLPHLIDGSMQAVNVFLGDDAEDLEFAIFTFTDGWSRWFGYPAPDLPHGWARLPNARALKNARAFVAGARRSGDTCPAKALRAAYLEARPDTTIVMVTDGEFLPGPSEQLLEYEAGRCAEAGEEMAPLVILKVGPQAGNAGALAALALRGGGGLWAVTIAPPAPPELPPGIPGLTAPPIPPGPY